MIKSLGRLLALYFIVSSSALASAQDDSSPLSPKPSFRISFGFGGNLTVDRWMPVRIDVTGGTVLSEGSVVVSCGSGARPSIRAIQDWIATPGRTTRVEIPMLLPSMTHHSDNEIFLSIVVLDDRGVPIRREEYSTVPRGTRMSMGVPTTPEVTNILDVDLRLHLPTLNLLPVSADVLPRSAMLYDSVGAVLLNSDSVPAMNSEQIAALREWVIGGGTLIIQSSPLSIHLTRLLPPELLIRGDVDSGVAGFVLTESAVKNAWRTLAVEGDQDMPTIECVLGPLGLGQVLIYDRTDMISILSEHRAPYLLAALTELGIHIVPDDQDSPQAWRFNNPWESSAGLDALASEFDMSLAFWWIPLLVLGIAIVIGLLDRLIMSKLRLLHRSWYSSMVWLLFFGLIAYSIPLWLRSGETTALAFQVSDHTSDGSAYRTLIAGVSAGESKVLRLVASEDAVQTWDRPVYAIDWSSSRSLSPRLDFLPERGARADTFPISLWTFNAIIRSEIIVSNITASLTNRSDGSLMVTVTGFPDSGIRRSAILLPGSEAYDLEFTRQVDGSLACILPPDRERALSLWRGLQLSADSIDPSFGRRGLQPNDELLLAALTLPGASQRSHALLRAGRFHNMSTLFIETEDYERSYPFVDLRTPTRTLFRIAAPPISPHEGVFRNPGP